MAEAACYVQALLGPLQPQSLGAAWPPGSRRGPPPTGQHPAQAGQPRQLQVEPAQPMSTGGVAAQQQRPQAQQACGALPAGGAALLHKRAALGRCPTAARPRAGVGADAVGAPEATAEAEGVAGKLNCRE